jgi:indolepyruvate ferredoxin oxidoreductase alpha subunit
LNRAIKELGYQKDEVIVTGDIGCTILGMNEPFRSCWTEISMGSSISLAQGFKYAGIQKPVIATIGDGTFFHGGIPALLNASHHRANLTVLILDNHWASMTGMQPHVGTGDTSAPGERRLVRVEDIVKASGVRAVWRVNPFQTAKLIGLLKEAIPSPDMAVLIADAECAIQKGRRRKTRVSLKVDPKRCIGLDACKPSCIEILGCPALDRGEDGRAFIDPDLCRGCGLCRHVCPYGAI